jgi:hypothetical protein
MNRVSPAVTLKSEKSGSLIWFGDTPYTGRRDCVTLDATMIANFN